jgi:hypothetical protein
MAVSMKDKIAYSFGISWACDKCGLVFCGKEFVIKHEKKCKGE